MICAGGSGCLIAAQSLRGALTGLAGLARGIMGRHWQSSRGGNVMWTAIIGFLVVVAIVFVFGILSAREAARVSRRKSYFSPTEANRSIATHETRSSWTSNENMGNDEATSRAMAMAGPTNANDTLPVR